MASRDGEARDTKQSLAGSSMMPVMARGEVALWQDGELVEMGSAGVKAMSVLDGIADAYVLAGIRAVDGD